MIEQLPPELAKLIAAERAAPVADHAMRALVRAKVAATVAGAPLGAVAGATAGAAAAGGVIGAGKIIAIIAVVLGAGAVAVVKTQQHASPVREHAAPVASVVAATPTATPTPTPTATPTSTPPPTAEPTPPPAPSPPPRPATAPSAAAPPKPSVPSQAELLQQAWVELGRGNASSALELATRDEKLHADGALAEERAAVQIVALAKLGREHEALDQNIEFTAKYPNSIHRDAIARALMGGTP